MSAFKVTGRHLKTGTLAKGLVIANSQESVVEWANEKFGHTNFLVEKISQVGCNLPHLDELLSLLDGNPFHNPEYETSPALEIADESEIFRNLGKCDFFENETERGLWLATIVDDHGITRQVQMHITSDPKDFLDEGDGWHETK